MSSDTAPIIFDLSVHDVIALASQGTSRPAGAPFSRARLGQEAHSRYQSKTAGRPGFRKEVPVSLETRVRGLLLRINGRIDAVVSDGGETIIEEIKSVFATTDEAARLQPAELVDWANQARLYRWMWMRSGQGPAEARLILASLLDDGWHTVSLAESREDLDRAIFTLLNRAAGALELGLETAARRRALAPRLRFPFPSYRSHQHELEQVAETVSLSGGTLAAEAPTGLGKTAAVLTGALRSALKANHKLFFLTAKGTQQKMALETFGLVRSASEISASEPFRITQIRAKEKMCLNDVVICDPEFCPYLKDYSRRALQSGALESLRQEGVITGDSVFETGQRHTLCPFELSLDLAWESEAVTCDYNYAFDPDVMLAELADPDLSGRTVLVVDEVHALPARARGYRSPVLDAAELERLASEILSPAPGEPVRRRKPREQYPGLFDSPTERLVGSPQARTLAREILSVTKLVRDPESCGVTEAGATGTYRADPYPEPFVRARGRLDRAFLDYLVEKRRSGVTRPHDPAAEAYARISKFVRTLSASGSETAALWTPENGGKLSLECIDASRFLASRWTSVHAAVLMSATLSPDHYFRTTLGLPPETVYLSFPSPFPPENLSIEIEGSVSTAWKERAKSLLPLAHRLREFLERPGNRAVFVPSFDYLAMIHDAVGLLEGKRFLVQSDRMTDAERQEFFRELASGSGDVVLWAALGGIFAEGIDLPGEHLVGVAIIGPGLPKPDAPRALEQEYWNEQAGGEGFEYAYLYPGMIRVIQSAGRLIRSETDRGELLLIDQRFTRPGYQKLFPAWWQV